METSNYFLFLVTSLMVIIAPGPGMLFVISSGLGGGRRAGIHAALGTSTGISVHIVATMLGISALLQTSAFAFGILKIIGAGYLFYLAWKIWRKSDSLIEIRSKKCRSGLDTFWRGFLINALNPKVAIFFIAFLPQFITENTSWVSGLMGGLGFIFLTLTMIIFLVYGAFAAALRSLILTRPRFRLLIERITGGLFGFLGLRILLVARD